MKQIFLTVYFWTVSTVLILTTFITCLICRPFVDDKTFSRIYELITGNVLIYFMTIPGFWNLKVKDRRLDKSWDNKQYIIIANHLSFVDTMFMSIIPLKKKYMVGYIFTKIPVFGWLTKSSGYIHADKHKPEINKDAVTKAIDAIYKDGCSFAIYPEGQRELKPYNFERFKTGAYRIAHNTKIPILPITLKGTAEAMPIGGLVNFSDIEITIDEPFYVTDDDYSKYIEKSKEILGNNLKN